jgi:hypothetical protein
MATLALAAVGGSLAGGSFSRGGLTSNLSALGGSIADSVLGQPLGDLAGAYIDQALKGAQSAGSGSGGPKLLDLTVTASTEGAPIPRLYGRARLGGQMIWATQLEAVETSSGSDSGGGGKWPVGGLFNASASQSGSSGGYLYYANFAIGVCEGPIARIGRVWADAAEFDLSQYACRIYYGTEDQRPDSLIEAKQGSGGAPAYRGLAYIVFERLPLLDFGNRIPQFNFEVFRAVDPFEALPRAITLIPAAGEFCYETAEVMRDLGGGRWLSENRRGSGGVDVKASLDALQEQLPGVGSVSLFVAWFGDDLRAANCALAPKVETRDKSTAPLSWLAGGLGRSSAPVVSSIDGDAAYGGTPSDHSVLSAIAEIKARGLDVSFTPFILMDIPAGNCLPDPYRAGTPAGQAVYPWRGRITVSPAPGVTGSPDQTSAAGAQIAAFVSTYRSFVLHYANLCAEAGGVNVFVIGSEMRGLTWARAGSSGPFPFVDALVELAADVKAILPAAKIIYAADWSEFTPYQTAQFGGPSGELFFHLDALWSSPSIDAIGIDAYWPLSDWRDGTAHLDYAQWRSVDDLAYLKGNIEGGEGYGWYYASQSARDSQTRTPITDTLGKPWVFRYKDICSWWRNPHYNRPLGTESGAPTAWRPESKPIWFTELGCPAVDKGSNQPNVFYDPKSSESFFPYYSTGQRDDVIQRRYLRAMIEYWAEPAHNPTSSVYGAPMIDMGRMFLYTWDARPYPAFPALSGLWADAANWPTGHWLNGRMGEAPLAETVAAILDEAQFSAYDVGGLTGSMQGYVIDRIMSSRQALEPLAAAFFFDSVDSEGAIRFRQRGRGGSLMTLAVDDLVDTGQNTEHDAGQHGGGGLYQLTRAQETDLPRSAKVSFINGDNDYARGVAEARRARAAMRSGRESQAQLPIVWSFDAAGRAASTLLHEAWAAREKARFRLPPSMLALEPGDVVTLRADGLDCPVRLTEISVGEAISVNAVSIDAHVYGVTPAPSRAAAARERAAFGPVTGVFLDLPLIRSDDAPYAGYVAAFSSPWPGEAAFYRSASGTGYALAARPVRTAVTGKTLWDFYPGPTGRWDKGARLQVKLYGGQLASSDDVTLFGGANMAAIENADGQWEVIQFATAELVNPGVYELSRFLRGQGGTETAMRSPVAAGARFVLLDGAVTAVAMSQGDVGVPFVWKYGPANANYGDWTYQTVTRAFSGLGLKPLAPCHPARTRLSSGDDALAWVRRTRVNGDAWEQAEVPLGEEFEAYDVEIMNGSVALRTLTVTAPAAIYTAAQQAVDWGGAAPDLLTARIYQRSASFGRGWPCEAILSL